MTHAETPVDPYPMLTMLDTESVMEVRRYDDDRFVFTSSQDENCWVTLDTAEVLALADELRRMAQPTPAHDPLAVIDQAAVAEQVAAFRKLFDIPEKVVKREGP